MPKGAASKASVLLDLQGLLARQPFANDVCPAESKRQQCDQLLQPLGVGDMSLFQTKAPTLQTREEGFNLPAPSVVRKRRLGEAWRDHDHVLARRETHATNEQGQAPDHSRPLNDEWLSNALMTEQTMDRNLLSTPVCNFRVLTHPDAEVHINRAQPREPILADKLPVRAQIRDRAITEDAPELPNQIDPLCGVRAAFLFQHSPEQRESHATVRDAQHHDIQRRLAKIPISPVHWDDPGRGHSQETHDEARHLRVGHLKEAEETLNSFIVRLSFGAPRKDACDLREVDGSHFYKSDDEASQEVDACSIPRYIVRERALQQAHVGHCAFILSSFIWR